MSANIFKPVSIQRLSSIVAETIRNRILCGDLKPGDRLPADSELSRQCGVSILTMREALCALEVRGIIERRRGKNGGAVVISITDTTVKDLLYDFFTINEFGAKDVTEMRMIIEPSIAKLAAANFTRDKLAVLNENIQWCEHRIAMAGDALSEKDFFEIEERNVEFHKVIADSTQNPIMSFTIGYLTEFLLSIKRRILTPDLSFSIRAVKDHRAIYKLISQGLGTGAEQKMRRHIRWVSKYLEAKELIKSAPE